MSHTFISDQFAAMYNIPAYGSWLRRQDMRPVYEFHRRFLQHLQYGRPARRFVLKAPVHMLSLETLFATYPDALVVQTHREPLEILPSAASLTMTIRSVFSDFVDPWTGGNPIGTSTRFISIPPFPTQTITTTLSGDATPSGWGGGMDFTYWFPWKYLGVRFQGAGLSLSTGTFTVTESLNGVRQARRTGSVSTAAGVLASDLMLGLPLDDCWPGVHLAPYIMGGMGAIFGGNSATINTSFPDLNARFNNATHFRSSPLGNVGGGLEYRFTPPIALFGDAGYNFVSHGGGHGANTNFVQTNFGFEIRLLS